MTKKQEIALYLIKEFELKNQRLPYLYEIEEDGYITKSLLQKVFVDYPQELLISNNDLKVIEAMEKFDNVTDIATHLKKAYSVVYRQISYLQSIVGKTFIGNYEKQVVRQVPPPTYFKVVEGKHKGLKGYVDDHGRYVTIQNGKTIIIDVPLSCIEDVKDKRKLFLEEENPKWIINIHLMHQFNKNHLQLNKHGL